MGQGRDSFGKRIDRIEAKGVDRQAAPLDVDLNGLWLRNSSGRHPAVGRYGASTNSSQYCSGSAPA